MKNRILFSLLVLALVLSACGGNGSAVTPSLTGTHWVLEQINGKPVIENVIPTLSFRGDQEVGGNASCNNFNGTYTGKDGALTIGPLATTMMACLEPAGLMEQEAAYLKALESAVEYRIEKGKLLIMDSAKAVVLTFAAQDMSLEGKTWNLTSFNDGQSLVSLVPDTQITAEFKDGALSGSSGCNSYHGLFHQQEQKLSFDTFAVTMMSCPEEGVMEQEAAYLSSLAKVTHFSVEGNRLFLFDANDLIMAQFSQ